MKRPQITVTHYFREVSQAEREQIIRNCVKCAETILKNHREEDAKAN